MKKFYEYLAIIFTVFLADCFSKVALLRFLCAKYCHVIDIYNPDSVLATNPINQVQGIIVPWEYIVGGDYGLSNFLRIQFVWNKGVSFSAFNNFLPVLLIIGTSLIIIWLLWYFIKKSASYERLPLAFIIGGALGNLFDRIRFGAVVDFIQFHIGNIWSFPAIFNVGDVFISLGVCLYFIRLFINRRRCLNNLKLTKDK